MPLQFIANTPTPAVNGLTLPVVDPSTGQTVDELPRGQAPDIDQAVRAARDAYDAVWQHLSATDRADWLHQWSTQLQAQALPLAWLHAQDSGTPVHTSLAQVLWVAQAVRNAARWLEAMASDAGRAPPSLEARPVAHGVCGHLLAAFDVLPMWARCVVPALAAGNTCVVKPSLHTSRCVLAMAQLTVAAGWPAGVLNVVTGLGGEAGDALLHHQGIDHLSVSGSLRVAISVQQTAALRQCPVRAEIANGHSMVLCADTAMDRALPALLHHAFHQSGQGLAASKQLWIESSIYEQALEQLGEAVEQLQVGPALRSGVDASALALGPLHRPHHQQQVWDALSDAQVDGLLLWAQGQIVDDAPEAGFYQAPALLRDVPPTHRLARSVLQGPLLSAMPFEDDGSLLSQLRAGPAARPVSLWCGDTVRRNRLADRLPGCAVHLQPPAPAAFPWPEAAQEWLQRQTTAEHALSPEAEAPTPETGSADTVTEQMPPLALELPVWDSWETCQALQDRQHYLRSRTLIRYPLR